MHNEADIRITRSCYKEMLTYLCASRSGERGGMLGAKGDLLCRFYPDVDAGSSSFCYTPCTAKLDKQRLAWQKSGIVFCGIAHSHLSNDSRLSKDDRHYIRRIHETLGGKHLFFPVVAIGHDRIGHDRVDVSFFAAHLQQQELIIEEVPIAVV